MAQQKEKRKVTTSHDTGYPLYEDGRFTHHLLSEDGRERRGTLKGKDLGVCHNKGYTTRVGPLNLKDLKALRKLVRQAIRGYEDNKSIQI